MQPFDLRNAMAARSRDLLVRHQFDFAPAANGRFDGPHYSI